jgi:hypothetical protein
LASEVMIKLAASSWKWVGIHLEVTGVCGSSDGADHAAASAQSHGGAVRCRRPLCRFIRWGRYTWWSLSSGTSFEALPYRLSLVRLESCFQFSGEQRQLGWCSCLSNVTGKENPGSTSCATSWHWALSGRRLSVWLS